MPRRLTFYQFLLISSCNDCVPVQLLLVSLAYLKTFPSNPRISLTGAQLISGPQVLSQRLHLLVAKTILVRMNQVISLVGHSEAFQPGVYHTSVSSPSSPQYQTLAKQNVLQLMQPTQESHRLVKVNHFTESEQLISKYLT